MQNLCLVTQSTNSLTFPIANVCFKGLWVKFALLRNCLKRLWIIDWEIKNTSLLASMFASTPKMSGAHTYNVQDTQTLRYGLYNPISFNKLTSYTEGFFSSQTYILQIRLSHNGTNLRRERYNGFIKKTLEGISNPNFQMWPLRKWIWIFGESFPQGLLIWPISHMINILTVEWPTINC